jgi:hypothetical protein
MSKKDEALKLALEALGLYQAAGFGDSTDFNKQHEAFYKAQTALTAVKQARTQTVQEPVECQYGNGGYACCEGGPCKADEQNNAAQPAPATLITREQHIALREAFAINSADLYFEANPTHDNDVGRMLFERGFARGFDSHERAIETAKKGNT